MQDKTDKLSWPEAVRVNIRAIRLLASKNKLLFPYAVLKALMDTVFTYLAIFLSKAVSGIAGGFLYHAYEVRSALFWNNVKRIEDEKFLSMDYCDVEDQKVRDLYDQICQNANWSGWGFLKIQWNFQSFVRNSFSVIGAVGMSVGLFTGRVPEESGLAFLNHPLTALGFLAAMFLVALIAPWQEAKNTEKRASLADSARLGNRLFSHFGFLRHNLDAMAEYRM